MIAIQPPAYFPNIAYMALMLEADCFVLADTFPYERRSPQNRGRLRTPQGWQWIDVPLRGGQRGRPICEAEINNHERWLVKHWRSFQYNYRSTPYFEYYEPQLVPFFEETWTHLGPLACASVELLCALLEGSPALVRASALPGRPATMAAVRAALRDEGHVATDADRIGLAGDEAPEAALQVDEPTYRQNFEGFEAGLSAADLIFNRGPEAAQVIRDSVRRAGEA